MLTPERPSLKAMRMTTLPKATSISKGYPCAPALTTTASLWTAADCCWSLRMTSQRIHTNSTLKQWRNDVISQRKFLTAALCSTDTRVAKTAKTVNGKRGSRKVEGEHVRKPTHIHTVREYMYVWIWYTCPETQVSIGDYATCRMPATRTKGDTIQRTPVANTISFKQGAGTARLNMAECFVLLKEQTKRKRMHSAPIRPYSEAHTHSTRIEKQRCSNFMLRIAESTLQKWNSNFEQFSQVSNQSVGGPRGI